MNRHLPPPVARPRLHFLSARLRAMMTRESGAAEEALQRLERLFGRPQNAVQLGAVARLRQEMFRHMKRLVDRDGAPDLPGEEGEEEFWGELTPDDAFFVLDRSVLEHVNVGGQLVRHEAPIDPARYSPPVISARRLLVTYVFGLIVIGLRGRPLVNGESAASRLQQENDMLAAASDFMHALQVMSIEMYRGLGANDHPSNGF